MTRARHARTRTATAGWPLWAWLLALALLHAQALGQWHRVQHLPGAASAANADHIAAFGHDAGDDAQCRLYDAVGSAAGPAPMAGEVDPPPAAGAAASIAVAALPDGRMPRRYEARGPPRA